MSTENVFSLPPTMTYTADQALASSMDQGLQDVIIVGYDADDKLFVRSSRMDRKEALWIAESLKEYIRNPE